MSIQELTRDTNEYIKIKKKDFYLKIGIVFIIGNLATCALFSFLTTEDSNIAQIDYYFPQKGKTLLKVILPNPLMLTHLQKLSIISSLKKTLIANGTYIEASRLSLEIKHKVHGVISIKESSISFGPQPSTNNDQIIYLEVDHSDFYKLINLKWEEVKIIPFQSKKYLSRPNIKKQRKIYEFKY